MNNWTRRIAVRRRRCKRLLHVMHGLMFYGLASNQNLISPDPMGFRALLQTFNSCYSIDRRGNTLLFVSLSRRVGQDVDRPIAPDGFRDVLSGPRCFRICFRGLQRRGFAGHRFPGPPPRVELSGRGVSPRQSSQWFIRF